jgi:hypothetical protein
MVATLELQTRGTVIQGDSNRAKFKVKVPSITIKKPYYHLLTSISQMMAPTTCVWKHGYVHRHSKTLSFIVFTLAHDRCLLLIQGESIKMERSTAASDYQKTLLHQDLGTKSTLGALPH